MPGLEKLVTCCYCGMRAVLVLRGTERHELSCANCAAPLHNMKSLPVDPIAVSGPGKPVKTARRKPKGKSRYKPSRTDRIPTQHRRDTDRRKPAKRRKSGFCGRFLSKAFEEAWDVVEDIFD